MEKREYSTAKVRTMVVSGLKKSFEQAKKLSREDRIPMPANIDWIGFYHLDPTFTEWDEAEAQGGYHHLAWSPRGCWTPLLRCMQELGEEGWELVGSTPPWQYQATNPTEFDLLFKRPKATGGD